MEELLWHAGLVDVGVHANGGAVDHDLRLVQGRFQGVRVERVVFNMKRRAFTKIAGQGLAFLFFDSKDREPADGGLKRQPECNGPRGSAGPDHDHVFAGKVDARVPQCQEGARSVRIVSGKGVVRFHDGIDGPDVPGRGLDRVQVGHDRHLMGNRDAESPEVAQGANSVNGMGHVFNGKREVHVIQPQVLKCGIVNGRGKRVLHRVAEDAAQLRVSIDFHEGSYRFCRTAFFPGYVSSSLFPSFVTLPHLRLPLQRGGKRQRP